MRMIGIRLISSAILVTSLVACTKDSPAPTASGNRLQSCPTAPTTCNSGERKQGGQITWLIEQGWGNQWNPMRPEGASFYAVQASAGTKPIAGDFLPTGEWAWNMDLFASEPRLTSTNPQTAEFVLRPEAVWSDGVPISADDFRYNWFHNSGRPDQCVGCDPVDTTGWADVASVESSDRTVTVTYKAGVHDPEWFARFGPSPAPAHVATKAGFDWHTPKGMGASSAYFRDTVPTWSGGPYLIQSTVPDQRVIMVPNPKWYGRNTPSLTKIVKEVITNQSDWPAALANGEIDGGAPLSYDPDVAQRLRSTQGISSALGSVGATWEHVDLNLKSPTLADLALRKAIFTALDVKDLRARLFGEVTPPLRSNPLFPAQSPHFKDVVTPSGFGSGDLAAARKLLTDAGYAGTEPGQHLTRKGAAVPDLRFVYITGHPTRGTFVEIAQQRLAQIGVTIKPVGIGGSNYLKTLRTGGYDLSIHAWDGGPLFTQLPSLFYKTGGGANFVGLADPGIDHLADAMLAQTDLNAAADDANQIATKVIADAVSLPLWENPSYIFVRDSFVNVRDNPMTSQRAMYAIDTWGVAGP